MRQQRDGREVLQGVVGQRLVQRRVGRVADVGHEQGVAVGRGLGDDVGADDAARAAAVLDHHGLAEVFGERRHDAARDDVGAAAGRGGDDEADGFVRVLGLREGSRKNKSNTQV